MEIFKGNYSGSYLGAFISPKLPDDIQYYSDANEMNSFSEQLGKKVSMFVCYLSWEKDGEMRSFPAEWCDKVYSVGAVPHITWEPWNFDRYCTKYSLDNILSGEYYDFIKDFALSVKNYGKKIFLRFGQEMNGFWYPWDGTHNFNDPGRYVDVYRYIHSIFKDLGVDNVSWVWSPEVTGANDYDDPTYDFRNYYPGDDVVDWLGMDGLNFGSSQNASTEWMGFNDIFGKPYNILVSSYPEKPIMVCHMASAELGGDKAQWVKDAFDTVKKMPNIKIVSLFNIEKETNWCIDSSDLSLGAYRESVSDDYYLENGK